MAPRRRRHARYLALFDSRPQPGRPKLGACAEVIEAIERARRVIGVR